MNKQTKKAMEMSAEEILALIKKRQNEDRANSGVDKEYEEYRKLQYELLEKGQEYHKLGCEMTELEAMIDGCYPPHYMYWWEAELLKRLPHITAKPIRRRTKNGSQGPQVEAQVEQIANLRSMLKTRRTAVEDGETNNAT